MSDHQRSHDTDAAASGIGFHELACFRRKDVLRRYNLHPVSDGVELWRITERLGQPAESSLEVTFTDAEKAIGFLDELNRTLRASGWDAL
jgi:hypothetical protein